jgi:hypothetical protein
LAFIVRSFREAVFVVDERTVGTGRRAFERLATGCRNRGVNCNVDFVAPRRLSAVHPPKMHFVARSGTSRRNRPALAGGMPFAPLFAPSTVQWVKTDVRFGTALASFPTRALEIDSKLPDGQPPGAPM